MHYFLYKAVYSFHRCLSYINIFSGHDFKLMITLFSNMTTFIDAYC